jgi:hypothetical protein
LVTRAERLNDHYLRPDDGRLDVLRVQHLEGYTPPIGTVTPWHRPKKLGPIKIFWRWLRNASTDLLVWTYADWLDAKENGKKGS